jgi:TatD DNase family protein
MIDTHAHIYDPTYLSDEVEMVERCKNAGVQHVILPNVDKESW